MSEGASCNRGHSHEQGGGGEGGSNGRVPIGELRHDVRGSSGRQGGLELELLC